MASILVFPIAFAQPVGKPAAQSNQSERSQAVSLTQGYYRAGLAATRLGEFNEALKQHFLAWEAAKHVEGAGVTYGVLFAVIGASYVDLKQDAKAEPFFHDALTQFKAQAPDEAEQIANILLHLSEISLRSGALAESKQWRLLEIVQLRKIADRVQINPNSNAQVREYAWFKLALSVVALGEYGVTSEGFEHIEAALSAMETLPSAIRSRLTLFEFACKIQAVYDPAKAQQLAVRGFQLAELLPQGDERRLGMARFVSNQAAVSQIYERSVQAKAQYKTALELVQSAGPSEKRDAAVHAITQELAGLASILGDDNDALTWALLGLETATTDIGRVATLIRIVSTQIRLRRMVEAKIYGDRLYQLEQDTFDPTNLLTIMQRMQLTEALTFLGEVDRAMSLYDKVRPYAERYRSRGFSQVNMFFLAGGVETLLKSNNASLAYTDLAQAGQDLVEGPGRTFGVSSDSRRTFNTWRFVFKNQMQAGWLAAHDTSVPPIAQRSDAPVIERGSN